MYHAKIILKVREVNRNLVNEIYYYYYYLLYNIVLVLPYINMNPPWVYTCSQS